MQIEVTEDDIRDGFPDKRDCCPIALAIKRACPKAKAVSVDSSRIVIDGQHFKNTLEVHNFVESFDEDRASVTPFSFEIPAFFEIPV